MSDLPIPAWGGRCLTDVLPRALVEHERVVLLLIDGLGAHALRAHRECAPFLTSLAFEEITTVFPSTTPIALTSLGTGLAPGTHGIAGLLIRLDDRSVINTLAFPDGFDVAGLQPRPTLFERAVEAGVAVTRVGPAAFDGRGLTMAGLRGGAYAAAETLGERIAAASAAARAPGRSLTYVYVGDLDAAGHRHGVDSEQWRQELTHTDRVVEQLAEALPAGTTLLVTSDHGMVDVPAEHRYDLATEPALDAGVETLTGDSRGGVVHAVRGAADDVLAAWAERLGDDFWVLPTDEAIAAGLFGEVIAVVRPRLGDLVFASRGPATVLDSRVAPPVLLGLVGNHGSLTPDELLVPLLTCHT